MANIKLPSSPLTAAQINTLQGLSLSPITISGSGGSGSVLSASSSGSAQWAGFDYNPSNQHELLRKYEVYESSESILTLSVAAKRLFDESKTYHKITDRPLYSKVTHSDRIMADAIKDYYSKKVMMWKLKGSGHLSPFREDMNKLIHSDMLTFKENMIGIAYWLPYFYQYDIDLDVIKSELTTNQGFDKMDKDGKPRTLQLRETLVPIKRLMRTSKRSKYYEYWFKDTELNAGVVFRLEEKNQLQNLWDNIFNKKEPLKIEGYFTRRERDDFQYYNLNNWSLEQA